MPTIYQRHCEAPGRANARPMTGSASNPAFLNLLCLRRRRQCPLRANLRNRPRGWNKLNLLCIVNGREFTRITAMQTLGPHKLLMVIALMFPLAAYAQSGGGSSGGGSAGGSAGGAASGPSAGTGSAAGSPNAGSAGAGTAGVSGVPSGPASVGGLNNSGNDPSGAGNAAKLNTSPGTNAAGTANSSGSASSGGMNGESSSTTTGAAGNRAGQGPGRIDGVASPGQPLRAIPRSTPRTEKSIRRSRASARDVRRHAELRAGLNRPRRFQVNRCRCCSEAAMFTFVHFAGTNIPLARDACGLVAWGISSVADSLVVLSLKTTR